MAITLITGAIKSGKSEFAEKIARIYKTITYIALSDSRPDDLVWQKKIKLHKSRRPSNWEVFENDDLLYVFKRGNISKAVTGEPIGSLIN